MTDVAERPTLDIPQVAIDAGTAALRDAAPPPAIQTDSVMGFIERAVRDPAVDVDKFERLLKIRAEMEFDRAYVALAGEIPRVKKNGTIDLIRKDGTNAGSVPFARWEDMDRLIRPLLKEHRFALRFDSQMRQAEGGGLVVTGYLVHDNGHRVSASVPLPIDTGPGRNNVQAMGSTLSYGKRYTAEMLLNIVREGQDDDGARAGMKFVSADDAEHIRLLIRDTKTNEADFLRNFFEVSEIANLSEQSAIAAKNMLVAKLRAMQKPKEPQQ